MNDSDIVNLLKQLQKTRPHNKIIIYDFSEKHPLYFIETDGIVWRVNGACDGCTRFCCDKPPSAYPEFKTESGGCKHYVRFSRDDVEQGMCDIQWNKPLGCAMYPFNDPKKLTAERVTWDEKNCQFKLVKMG